MLTEFQNKHFRNKTLNWFIMSVLFLIVVLNFSRKTDNKYSDSVSSLFSLVLFTLCLVAEMFWEKMKDKVKFSPVILDPNTAYYGLFLSDDLTKQQLPDNPERNTRHCNVFGSQGFKSGKHIWEVEVGDYPHWTVGLVKESVDRKGEFKDAVSYGIWCLSYFEGKYSNGGKILRVKKNLQRIRVQLDYDMGDVSFYDSEDMTLICTKRHMFTEKLFPYFNVGKTCFTIITTLQTVI
uniref:B30.2/SPRY domain-containing protein n=1 Tax=Poecilia reticulata TaxID=8081 RepID=A0A3P9N8S7_POERE